LTPTEQAFYQVLQSAVPIGLQIQLKVRLADLVRVAPNHPQWQAHWNRIQAKHVDFVLCTRTTLAPVLVIELDDPSHQRVDRQQRDAFVDTVLQTSGIPILHIPTAPRYDPAQLAAQIQPHRTAAALLPLASAPPSSAVPPPPRDRRRTARQRRAMYQMFIGCWGGLGLLLAVLPRLALGPLGGLLLLAALPTAALILRLDYQTGCNLTHSGLTLLLLGASALGGTYGILWYFTSYLPASGQPLFNFRGPPYSMAGAAPHLQLGEE
jgi:hypothetical protein